VEILVTGAAGYIGSIVTELLLERGHRVTALDNLSTGHRAAVASQAEFVAVDLLDEPTIEAAFKGHTFEAVFHLAALAAVETAMSDPSRCFRVNFSGSLNLVNCMARHAVKRLVYSSTAAVYGQPREVPVSEETSPAPINPYGESKLMFEQVLPWFAKVHGLDSVSLRYFNVAGASAAHGSDKKPETALIPRAIEAAIGRLDCLPIYGTDYPTRDGTCVRDYIHVLDVARAHLAALLKLEKPGICSRYNLGIGHGFTVREVIDAVSRVSGAAIRTEDRPRRPGDPAEVVASARKAEEELGWRPECLSLEPMIESAWRWSKAHPSGYGE